MRSPSFMCVIDVFRGEVVEVQQTNKQTKGNRKRMKRGTKKTLLLSLLLKSQRDYFMTRTWY